MPQVVTKGLEHGPTVEATSVEDPADRRERVAVSHVPAWVVGGADGGLGRRSTVFSAWWNTVDRSAQEAIQEMRNAELNRGSQRRSRALPRIQRLKGQGPALIMAGLAGG